MIETGGGTGSQQQQPIPIVVIIQPDAQNGLDKESLIRVPDISTFDKIRLKRKLGSLQAHQMEAVDEKLRIHLSL